MAYSRYWLCLVTCVLFLAAKAQEFPSEIWHTGKLVTIDGDTLKGNLKYNLELDIVQLQIKGKVATITAQKLYYFEIFDNTVDNFRYFYALPFANEYDYEVPMIFEVLHEGKMSLLTREKIVTETLTQTGYYYSPNYLTRQALGYDFYFLRERGELEKFSFRKNELETEFMKDRADHIRSFIRKNKLKIERKADLVRIVYYYNTLI